MEEQARELHSFKQILSFIHHRNSYGDQNLSAKKPPVPIHLPKHFSISFIG